MHTIANMSPLIEPVAIDLGFPQFHSQGSYFSCQLRQRDTRPLYHSIEVVPSDEFRHLTVKYSAIVVMVVVVVPGLAVFRNVHLYIFSVLPFLYVLTSIMSICTFCHFKMTKWTNGQRDIMDVRTHKDGKNAKMDKWT